MVVFLKLDLDSWEVGIIELGLGLELVSYLFAHGPIAILIKKAKIHKTFEASITTLSMLLKTFSRGVSSPMNSPKDRRPSKSRSILSKKSETSFLNKYSSGYLLEN